MNKEEFATFAAALRTYYPRETLLPNKQAAELWYMELQDLPYNVTMTALRKHVHTHKWSPSIAELREMAAEVQYGEQADWGEGWQQVLNAIRFQGMHREREALETMDDITRAAVERLGFKNICISDNIVADRARFRDIYEQLKERKKRDIQIPDRLKIDIKNIQAQKSIEQAAEKMRIGSADGGHDQ